MALFSNILTVVDSTADQHPELQRAMKCCRGSATKLHLIDLVKDLSFSTRLFSGDYAHIHELLVKEKRESLAGLVSRCAQAGVAATSEVVEGTSSAATLEIARRIGADLIIRSAKGERSLARGPLGSSSQKLLRDLPCPLWLTKAGHEPAPRLIVAAVDATPNDEPHAQLNRRIIRTALALASNEESRLLIVYAWSLYSAELLSHRLPPNEYEVLMSTNRQEHEASFDRLLAEFQLDRSDPQVRLIEGEPSTCIPEFCDTEGADLLVCGTVARRGIAGLLLGNTAERILNHIECSSLALPPLNP